MKKLMIVTLWLLVGLSGTAMSSFIYPNVKISLSFGAFMVVAGPMAWSPVLSKGLDIIIQTTASGSNICVANCKDGT